MGLWEKGMRQGGQGEGGERRREGRGKEGLYKFVPPTYENVPTRLRGGPTKLHTKLMSITLPNLDRFPKIFHWKGRLCSKFAVWCLGAARSARDYRRLACNFTKRSTILKLFTGRLSNKPFSIWLLTIPPHLECVATLPCNLSLIACFLKLVFHKV